ncbi:MAG: hypothetical protein ACP5K8_07745 [Nitrososphaeria archaeon]
MKWAGKQGRLEIAYDEVDGVWRGFMSVKVEKPPKRGGNRLLYIDLGIINLATIWTEKLKQPIASPAEQSYQTGGTGQNG